MYTVDYFNRCSVTWPDLQSAPEFRQICKQNGLETKIKRSVIQAVPKGEEGDFGNALSPPKRLPLRMQSYDGKKRPSVLFRGAAEAATTILAGDNPLQIGKNDSETTENDSPYPESVVFFGKATEREELKAIRESSMRSKLLQKLSDANNYGRYLQRQVREKEVALLNCKRELTKMEVELQALVSLLAAEAAASGTKTVSHRIHGKYVQSHAVLKLQELQKRFLSRVKEIDSVCFREVPIVWYGMAEAVQVMGSFDGWSQGEVMSPETSSSLTKFSALLKLRPGRYEIKLLVDGEWKILPDLPAVGEGITCNNLLVVE